MNSEAIYISTDSPKSPFSTAVNVPTPVNFQSPPSRFNSLFSASIKRCSTCLTSLVHFFIICQICNKLSCCKCAHNGPKCCGIYLLSKVNRIVRTVHYPFVLSDHVCTLSQKYPPLSKYFDENLDSHIRHEKLVEAKFMLNMLVVDNLCSGDFVFTLLISLISNIKQLDSVFVHILFKNYVTTSTLMGNLNQMQGEDLPQLPASENIDTRFRMSYDYARLTQKRIRRNNTIKKFTVYSLVLLCLSITILAIKQ